MDLLATNEREHLDRDGYLVLEGIVQPDRVKAMRDRLEALLAATEQEHRGTLIVGGLLEEEVFDAAWLHPRVLAAVRHVLGDGCRLTGVASRGIQPGHGQQALHADWGKQGVPGVWYGCHAICAVVDFTKENGATRVVPGSHRNPKMLNTRHDPRKPHPAQRQLIGAAGTVFVLNIHCGHSAVHNASKGQRHALFTCFSRRDSPLLLADALPVADPSPKTLARFSVEVQALLKR
jgi:ectoine hydroxylase-related dioxygenase (phytanoyl-CoA dioxygenase family)